MSGAIDVIEVNEGEHRSLFVKNTHGGIDGRLRTLGIDVDGYRLFILETPKPTPVVNGRTYGVRILLV